MLVLALVSLVAALAGALYLFLERRYSTWKRKGVPGPKASVLAFNVPKVMLGQENMGDVTDRIYNEYRDSPLAGTYMFGSPLLHIHDTEIIKHVLIKEFQDFNGRGIGASVSNAAVDPLATHLFFQSGQPWKTLRVKLAPAFTSGKIKYMFETIRECSYQLSDYLDERIAANGGSHCEDSRTLMMRLFVDTIASVVFGIESNVVKNPESEFFTAAQEAVAPKLTNALRSLLAFFARRIMEAFSIRSTSASTTKFFLDVVQDTVDYRENNKVDRPDLLSLLIQLKNRGFVDPDKADGKVAEQGQPGGDKKLTMNEVAANVFVFFIAGFESSSGTSSFTLYELAKNPEIQKKVQQEVDQVLADFDGKITYDAIMSMPYLEMCINETLRKYPPLAFITREAMVTRKMPLSEVTVDKGTRLVVPVRALHYDPLYWPEPEKYDPERHTAEKKASRPAVAFMPFGEGPRICIAARLGVVQIKTALVRLLSKYTVTVSKGEPDKIRMNPKSFVTTPDMPLKITFHPRKPADGIQKRRQSVVSG